MTGPLSIDPTRQPADSPARETRDLSRVLGPARAASSDGPDAPRQAAAAGPPRGFSEFIRSELLPPPPSEPAAGVRLVKAYVPSDDIRRQTDQILRDSLERGLPAGQPNRPTGIAEQIRRYKEDQLLANPGGDHYHTDRTENVIERPGGPSGFFERIGKDLKDAGRNFLNLVENFFFGAEYKYRGSDGAIHAGRRKGLLGTLGAFAESLLSGLSFGAYVPEGETPPEGVGGRVKHFFTKVFGEGLMNNLIAGVPRAVGHMVKDAALGVLNLAEVIPDATIGNLPEGERLVTKTFDNAQVVVSYAVDILPYGDAWSRVNAPGSADGGLALPIVHNLRTPATGLADSNWATVRNTPFRKAIETAGSLVTSALSFFLPNLAFPKPAGTGEELPPERHPPPPPSLVAQLPPEIEFREPRER